MKRVLTLFLVLFFWSQADAQKIITVSINQGEDATPIVRKILEQNNGQDIVISFAKGRYKFLPEKAVGKYHAVTNHDNIYRYFAFPLINCSKVTIDGNGSMFLFEGMISPFLVERSTNITLKNFSIDWSEPFYVQATVLKSDKNSMEVEFTSFSKVSIEDNRIVFRNNGYFQPNIGETMVFDPKTRAVAYRANDYLLAGERSKAATAKHLGDRKYLIEGKFPKSAAPAGMIYVFKGPGGQNRLAQAIHLSNSDKVVLQDINIYHAGGMGVVGEKTNDITLRRVNVVLPNDQRIVTTTADATHFCNCKGELLIEDCLFENMLDDATNVHGTYMRVAEITGDKTMIARLIHPQQLDYDFASGGDTIQFVDSQTILPIKTNKLVSFNRINQNYAALTFACNIPSSVKVDDGLENITWYPSLIFRGNTVRNNRARSILISTRNRTLIENNSFSSMMTSILFEGDLDYWNESGAVQDVLIRNNIFGDNVYGGGRGGAVIWINPHIRKKVSHQPYERNIRIENNVFKTFDASILNATSVEGLVFKDNIIEPSSTYHPIAPDNPTIKLDNCVNTIIEGNIYKGKEEATVVVDEHSSKDMIISDQKGFSAMRIDY